ncbi:exported hypothetical protein [Verrucomicrobia bacterium]|nr:exported hypothetical protein [Verrucomicrobiota bacterium]
MKLRVAPFHIVLICALALGIGSASSLALAAQDSSNMVRARSAIPWAQIGTKAAPGYRGDGLAVSPSAEGARLHCLFQRLEAHAAREGLWLTSTASNSVNDRFHVVARAVGRGHPTMPLPSHGHVSIDGRSARLNRPGLVEEYSVSLDGVRQDFVVLERPAGAGELTVCWPSAAHGPSRRVSERCWCWKNPSARLPIAACASPMRRAKNWPRGWRWRLMLNPDQVPTEAVQVRGPPQARRLWT